VTAKTAFYLILVIGSAIWVGSDAKKLGVRRGGLGGGFFDLPTYSWVLATLLIWIIGFPCYLVARGKYQALNASQRAYAGMGTRPQAGAYPQAAPYPRANPTPYAPEYSVPAQSGYFASAAAAPTHVSPDGRWWWNGQQWVAMPVSPTG
jgi:hypothetical protein